MTSLIGALYNHGCDKNVLCQESKTIQVSISSEQIKAIRESADIVRIISAFVQLKPKGQHFVGLCPFHTEKTPSFWVTPSKNMFYCYGCHVGGDVFSFLMKREGIDFNTAARQIAQQADIAIEPPSPRELQRKKDREVLHRINSIAHTFFRKHLFTPAGQAAQHYLQQRNIPLAFARERGLGYGGTRSEFCRFMTNQHVTSMDLARAGMMSDNNEYFLFTERIVFPIFNVVEQLAGFGGRRLVSEKGPKYINSKDTSVFNKKELFYGLEIAKKHIQRQSEVILVEGYMDVLACQQAGLLHAIAALGTAFTEYHAELCSRMAKSTLVVFDADEAGIRASQEAVTRLLQTKSKTKVVLLPSTHDPSSWLKKEGAASLKQKIENAKPAVEFFIEHALGGHSLSIEDKVTAIQQIAPMINVLGKGLEQDLYIARLANQIGVETEQIRNDIKKYVVKQTKRSPQSKSPMNMNSEIVKSPKKKNNSVEKKLARFEQDILRELFLFPSLKERYHELSEYAGDTLQAILVDLQKGNNTLGDILQQHIGSSSVSRRLLGVQPFVDKTHEEIEALAVRTFDDVLQRLKVQHLESNRQELLAELKTAEADGIDTDEIKIRVKNLTRRKRELKRRNCERMK